MLIRPQTRIYYKQTPLSPSKTNARYLSILSHKEMDIRALLDSFRIEETGIKTRIRPCYC